MHFKWKYPGYMIHFAAKNGSKSAGKAELWQIWQGDLNRAFSEILQRGGPREISQKSPNKKADFRGLKNTPAQIALSHNYCALKLQTSEICGKKRLQKCPEGRVSTNVASTLKSRIFWDFAKGGPREISQKSPKKWADFRGLRISPAQIALSCK